MNGDKEPSRRRGRRRGVEIRPGSVKQARLDAGLSLGQLAKGDISRTAIYFVETGKAKPSMETLRLIADRTGRPLDFFLVAPITGPIPAVQISELERLIAIGDNVGAAARSEHLLGQRLDAASEARVKYLAAQAYLRLAQPGPAKTYAMAARAYFEHTGDRLMAAEALAFEAQAAYLIQDPSALPLAEAALEKLRALSSYPQSTESQLLSVLASVHLVNGNWSEAIRLYEEAIAAGEVVHDLHRLSLMYSGLSYAYQETGHFGDATRYAQKALTIHETLNDRLSLARSLNNLGNTFLRMSDFASARKHMDRALHIFEEEGVETNRGNVFLSLCELELGEGNLAEAVRRAEQAIDVASRVGEDSIVSEGHTWLGRLAAERKDTARTDAEFAAALAAAESLVPRLIQVHEAYAEVLEARGDLAAANQHLKQAIAAGRPGGARAAESRAAIA